MPKAGSSLSWVPSLYPYYIITWVVCQEVFNIFFKSFGRPQLRSHILSPLDAISIPQTAPKVNKKFS